MKFRVIALSAAALALSLSACAKDDTAVTTESGIELIATDTLTICTHLPYEPFEYTESGEVVGFDVDLLEAVADAEGFGTEVVDIGWETIVSGEALNTGKCDVSAGAMTITPEREAVMDFSDPYFEATQALLAQTGSGITDLSDLADKRIAVQEGTTGEDYVKENAPEGADIVSYEDSALMMAAVKTGNADAGVNDNGLLLNFANKNPDVEIVNEFKTGEEYGFSVKKGGNDALLEAINAVIADQATYDEIFERWFGEAPAS